MSEQNSRYEKEIFTQLLKSGKRTYFFDVRETRAGDYYLTITESKKHIRDSGEMSYEKHKIYLYKEDFEKFAEGLQDVVSYIKNNQDVVEKRYEGGQEEVSYERTGTYGDAKENFSF